MPTKERDRIYWDSCCIIDVLQRTPGQIAVLEEYITKAEKRELDIVTSAWALVEVNKFNGPPLRSDQEAQIRAFFENPYILLRALDRRVGEKSREIMRHVSKIKPKDAAHMASAALSNVSVMHTYDGDLIKASGRIMMANGAPLVVARPNDLRPPILVAVEPTHER